MKTLFRLVGVVLVAAAFVATVNAVRVRSVRESDREAMRVGLEDVARRVRSAAANLVTVTEMNNRTAIATAHALALIIAKDPSVLADNARFLDLRDSLDVEELHVTDEKGVVRYTTIPETSLGFDLASSDQSRPFLGALTNRTFELAQEPMVKPQDGRVFQFAGVSRVDRPGVVQISYSAERVAKARRLADVNAIASSTRIGRTGRVEISPLIAERAEAQLGFREEETAEGRFYLIEEFVGANRICVRMPIYGTHLADDLPFAGLCVFDALVLVLIALTRFTGVTEVFVAHFKSLVVLFAGVPRAGETSAPVGRLRRWMANPVAHATLVAFVLSGVVCWFFFSQSARSTAEDTLRRAAAELNGLMNAGVDQHLLAKIAGERCIGASGFFLVAQDETGEIETCGKTGPDGMRVSKPGDTLAGIGFDVSAVPRDPNEVFAVMLYGEECLCLSGVKLRHRAIAAIPMASIIGEARRMVLTTLSILFVVFVLVAFSLTRLSGLVASLKGYIADAAARVRKEMAMAKAIQLNALPNVFPPYPDLIDRIDLYARMLTAREVGGDFYDFFFVAPGKLALVVADVSGKGVPAALFMMRAKTTIQAMLRSGLDIVRAVTESNNRLADSNESNMFVTAWIGIVDISTGDIEYVNAGHNPPLVKRADGTITYLSERCGPALAAVPGAVYRRQTIHLMSREGLVLYTDGVTEAMNSRLELYGEDRLKGTLTGLLGAPDAQVIVDGVVSSVETYADGFEQSDDMTLLAFRLLGA